jgi:hypothetical protein
MTEVVHQRSPSVPVDALDSTRTHPDPTHRDCFLGFSYLRPSSQSVSVTYADVESVLPPAAASDSQPEAAALPENVKRVLGGNEKVLEGWLNVLATDERPHFIRMMSTVITDAEAKKAPNVIAVVNKFKELYFERRGSTAFEPYDCLSTDAASTAEARRVGTSTPTVATASRITAALPNAIGS